MLAFSAGGVLLVWAGFGLVSGFEVWMGVSRVLGKPWESLG